MSLDYFYDAVELMNKSEHPFVIICAPQGTKSSHICIGNGVLEEPRVADKVMQSLDKVYDQICEVFDVTFEEFDDDDEEEY